MLNKVVLIGRLTKDPEIKYIPSGAAVTNFTLAVNRNFTNQQGDREADFIPIVVWRRQAENCAKYLAKGRLAAVSGRIQTRSYDTQDGQRRYITEIIADDVQFLDRGNSRDTGFNSSQGQDNYQFGQTQPQGDYNNNASSGFQTIEGEDDDLPF